jgi:hypothetical protein
MRPMTLSLTVLLGLLGAGAHAQEPVAGQPYAIPQGYESYPAGSMITYGGYNYVTLDNGTMLLADSQDNSGSDNGTPADDSVPIDTTAYEIPPGYEDAQPGSQISYGGNDYTVMSGGTMMMCNPGYSIMDSTLYQIPPDCAGAGVGSVVTYGGFNYLVGAGVMVKININAGYSAKPVPDNPGSTLTRPGTTGSTTHPVNTGHPGTTGSTVHDTLRPPYPGAVHPGWGNPGAVHPGAVHPGAVHPGAVHPGAVHPGWGNPGAVHPGWGSPGVVHPGTVRPGWGNPGTVHSGGGRPITGAGRGHHR